MLDPQGVMPAQRSERPLRVGYVVKMYPRFSETFIVNEILELERQGVEVSIYSLIAPNEGRFHDALARVKARATYLPAPRHSESWRFLQQQLAAYGGRWPGLRRAFAHALGCGLPSSLKYLLQAIGLIQAMGGEEHLHAHFASSPAHVAMYASLLSGVPFSFTAHAKDIYHDDYQGDLLADKIRHAARVVTVADQNREHLVRRFGAWAEDKVVRVYNGLDLELFKANGAVREPDLVIGVGRLVEKKGFTDLLEATARLKQSGRSCRVVIVGDGDQRRVLRERIRSLDLGQTVELAGALPQAAVRDLLGRASLMVLPCVIGEDGNRDALPTVLLEALAMGVPVVSTPITGIPEILDHNRAGVLVPAREPARLAEAMSRLLAEPQLRAQLALRGREHAERLFDVRSNVAQLAALFREARAGASEPVKELSSC